MLQAAPNTHGLEAMQEGTGRGGSLGGQVAGGTIPDAGAGVAVPEVQDWSEIHVEAQQTQALAPKAAPGFAGCGPATGPESAQGRRGTGPGAQAAHGATLLIQGHRQGEIPAETGLEAVDKGPAAGGSLPRIGIEVACEQDDAAGPEGQVHLSGIEAAEAGPEKLLRAGHSLTLPGGPVPGGGPAAGRPGPSP